MEGPTGGWSVEQPQREEIGAAHCGKSGNTGEHRPPVRFPPTHCVNSGLICNSSIALRGIFLDNLHAALDAPTALNVTVPATRRREARRSSRPREYLTEGHRSIASTARYTALAPDRFKDFWKD